MKVYQIYDGHSSRSFTEDEIITLADFSAEQIARIERLEVNEGCELISRATGFFLQVDRGPDLPDGASLG